MTREELESDLEWSIAFAIGQFRYQPPRTHNTDERAQYYNAVAKAVMACLRLTWNFEEPDIMRHKPPKAWHSTPPCG